MGCIRSLALVLVFTFVAAGGASAAVVLQYHHVSEDTPAATSTSPRQFRQHLEHIRESGYRVVPLQDLVANLRAGEALPEKSVAITFDDGYRSVYTEAFPLLKERGWPFTVFVNTRPLEQDRADFVSWDELREMAEAGATVANHSHSHPHFLRRNDGESRQDWLDRLRDEVLRAEELIAEHTGQRHRLFAWPYGEYDPDTLALLAELDFTAFGQQSGPLNPSEPSESALQSLPRFPFGGPYGSLDDFATKLGAVPLPLESVRVRAGDDRLEGPVLPEDVGRPILELELADAALADRLQCFASGQGAIPVQVDGATVSARADDDLSPGRSRYNCTAASGEAGRFHWYSQLFIRKRPDGSWYAE